MCVSVSTCVCACVRACLHAHTNDEGREWIKGWEEIKRWGEGKAEMGEGKELNVMEESQGKATRGEKMAGIHV